MTEYSIDVLTDSLRRSGVSSSDEDTILAVFNFCFPDSRHLESALDLVDKNRSRLVTSIRGTSDPNRRVWRVLGSKGTSYVCLRQFCPCRSFVDMNRTASSLVFCKHLISIRLAECFSIVEDKVLGDQEFVDVIAQDYSSRSDDFAS